MKYETYLSNKDIVLSRYKENEFGYDFIDNILKGIHNKDLFFKILTMDYRYHLFMVVSSLDRHKLFYNYNNEKVGSRIKIFLTYSRYNKHPYLFEKDFKLIKQKPVSN